MERNEENELDSAKEQVARLTMAFDMVHELIGILTEESVIDKIFILFSKLFAPRSIIFKSLSPNESNIYKFPPNIEIDEKIEAISINDLGESELWRVEENNLYLGISFNDRPLGILLLQDLAFSEYVDKYIYPALIISKVCGLAISNARIHHEHSRTLDDLKDAMEELKELDRLKSMFLASVSHELRTPLNSVIGFTGWLLMGMEGDLNEEQRKQLTMVKFSANHLLDLINDILDISKIEAGKMELSIEKFEIAEIVNDVVSSVLPLAKDKELGLMYDIPKGIILNSDKRRIKQILMNLVSNAIKFTDQGNVKIEVKLLNNKDLEVTVSDSGIGIKKEDMEKLFQPFQQIDMSSSKSHEGTGLGLYLSKKIIDLLHGDISVTSQFGKGSEFKFIFPIKFREEV